MNPTVRQWVRKAEGDFVSAQREVRARKAPNHDSACFHAPRGGSSKNSRQLEKTHDCCAEPDNVHG